MYNFNEVESRRGTHSVMWDCIEEKCGKPNDEILPAWVADMDFPSDPAVVEELTKRIATGYLGYAGDHRDYKRSYIGWVERRHGFKIEEENLLLIPGVKVGINSALEALGNPGDGVIIQSPVYDPFFNITETRGMKVVKNPLLYEEGRYSINFPQLEELAAREENKFLIICNPHNPVGRVWTREELTRVGEICLKNNITIIADEMYSDLTVKKYTPMASISKEVGEIIVALSSPSKTFNIMAFNIANLVVADRDKRGRIQRKILATGHGHLNLGGLYGGEVAYRRSEEWVDSVMKYIVENHTFFTEKIKEKFPHVRVSPAEGGFLAWVDLRGLGLPAKEIEERLLERGRILVSQGAVYGLEGEGFIRVNLGGTRRKVEEIVSRIVEALR